MEKRLIPEIRFKGFKGDWEEKKLGDILAVNYGRDYKLLEEGDVPVYGTGGIISYVNDYISREDSVGLGRKGTIDKPIQLKHPFWTVDTLFYIEKKENNSIKFIYNLLSTIKWQKYDESTGVPSLSKKNIISIKRHIPQFDEQEKIGRLFERLDQTIDLQGKVVEENKRLKQALLQKLFPKKGQKLPELRLKGFSGDWDIVPLGKLGTISSAGVDKNKYENQTEVYLLNYMDVYNKKQISDDNKSELMVVTASKKEIDEKNVKKGDIFFTPSSETREDIGHSMVIKNNIENLVYSYHIVRFRPNNNHTLDLNYSDYFANIEPVRRQFIREGQGVQRVTLKKEKFENVLVPIPSLPEQEAIGKLFKALDEKIFREEERLEGYKTLKKSLLQKMFV